MGIKIERIQGEGKDLSGKEQKGILEREIHLFGSRFSNRAKEDLYGELSVLLTSGINLKDSLQMISEMQKRQGDRELLDRISGHIVGGSSLGQALDREKHFSAYEQKAISIGEQTGQLARVTGDLRDYFHRKNELKRQLIATLSYPIIVLVFALIVVFFMLRYVVPMFADIFEQNRVELPWITQQVVRLSGLASLSLWWLLAGAVTAGLVFRWISGTGTYYRLKGRLQLRIPVLGNYLKRVYLIQFTQAMSLLTQARIPVVNGIALTRGMIRFYPLEATLYHIERDVVQGEKLHKAFGKHLFYDKKMVALLRVAEETNQTEYIFGKLYERYSNELQYKGKIITSVFNFMLTLVVGLIVGLILVAMYLPMFRLSSVIG